MDDSKIKYRLLIYEDLDKLALFFSCVYKQSLNYGSKSLFNWKIFKNVAAPGFVHAATYDEEIVSTTSITPKTLFLKSSPVQAAEIGDTYTDDKFQRKGLFANLVNMSREKAQGQGHVFIYGTPNANSLPGYLKKCEFSLQGAMAVRSYTLPLSIDVITGDRVPSYVLFPIDALLKCALKVVFFVKSLGVKLQTIKSFDDSHNSLWRSVQVHYDFTFNKDSASLNWRFVDNPYSYEIQNVFYRKHFCGFIVTRVSEDNQTLFIAEAIAHPDQVSNFKRGLAKVVCQNLGKFRRINTWVSLKDPLVQTFRSCYFIQRQEVSIIAFKNKFVDSLGDIGRCHFSMADSDNI